MTSPPRAVLRVSCQDRPGLVADLAVLLFRLGVNILHADEHIDPETNIFFQRVEFTLGGGLVVDEPARAAFRDAVASACEQWGMRFALRFLDRPLRVALLVSKRGHCALDLLARHRAGELHCEVPVVVSNHDDLADDVGRLGYRFVHEPIVAGDRADQERRIEAHIARESIDLVVLARYMQILSPELVGRWRERVINIHHSFLPAFSGADPYRQAYRRGVKLIGATSHYVTAELDGGPIISQDVAPVSHRDTVEDMVRKGRDVERQVLSHAVRCHLEDRILTYANRTIVFD
jgi:formyltetrahydrofolate deformylase